MKKVLKWIGIVLGGIVCLALLALAFFLTKPLFERTVYEQSPGINLRRWMADIPDETPLEAINIPGTHDSGAARVQLAYFARCQQLGIADQLDAGFRVFDIRLAVDGDAMYLTHGFCVCKNERGSKLYLDEVLSAMYRFLEENPSETIVFTVKHEHGDESDAAFWAVFSRYLNADPAMWYTDAHMPQNLGAVRGKIVLMRRFNVPEGGVGMYIDWSDQGNSDHAEQNFALEDHGDYAICVQDRYHYGADDKWAAFTADAPTPDMPCPVIDYLSITGQGIPHPFAMAKQLNARFMATDTLPSGWLIVDFGSAGMAEKVVRTNY